jgi:hypothetical protein
MKCDYHSIAVGNNTEACKAFTKHVIMLFKYGWISFKGDTNTFNVNTNHLSNHTNINGKGVNALIFKDVACDEKMVVLRAYEYPK